jgi:hypothetical protein
MQRIGVSILVLMPGLSVVAAVANGQDKSPTPSEQYHRLRATAVARWRLPAPQAPQGLGGPHAAGLGQPVGVASYGLFCLRGAAWRAYNQRDVRPGGCNAHRRGAGKQVTRFSSTGFQAACSARDGRGGA